MEIFSEFLFGHVTVAVDSLLVGRVTFGVVLHDFSHLTGEYSFAVNLGVSKEDVAGGSALGALVLGQELLVHLVDVSFGKSLLSGEHVLEVVVDRGRGN